MTKYNPFLEKTIKDIEKLSSEPELDERQVGPKKAVDAFLNKGYIHIEANKYKNINITDVTTEIKHSIKYTFTATGFNGFTEEDVIKGFTVNIDRNGIVGINTLRDYTILGPREVSIEMIESVIRSKMY